ncbi:hypothetical protein [Nocardioides dilutus]
MLLTLTRDSVAAGDDATAPNERRVDLPDPATLRDLVAWLERERAGASVVGGATWTLRLRGQVAAVLSQSLAEVVVIGDPALPLDPADSPHLEYLLGLDPRVVISMVEQDPGRTDLDALARSSWHGLGTTPP